MSALDDAMPEPDPSDQVPDEGSEAHARNIIWNFENLRMLIGTDLPIFGGDTRPCVSLRLTDMAKPINVLTGEAWDSERDQALGISIIDIFRLWIHFSL